MYRIHQTLTPEAPLSGQGTQQRKLLGKFVRDPPSLLKCIQVQSHPHNSNWLKFKSKLEKCFPSSKCKTKLHVIWNLHNSKIGWKNKSDSAVWFSVSLCCVVALFENKFNVFRCFQDLTKHYNGWKGTIEALSQRSTEIPPLVLDPDRVRRSTVVKALCSLQTREVSCSTLHVSLSLSVAYVALFSCAKRPGATFFGTWSKTRHTTEQIQFFLLSCFQIQLDEGDEITITDISQPNRLRVRLSGNFILLLIKIAVDATTELWTESRSKGQSVYSACVTEPQGLMFWHVCFNQRDLHLYFHSTFHKQSESCIQAKSFEVLIFVCRWKMPGERRVLCLRSAAFSRLQTKTRCLQLKGGHVIHS